MIPFEAEEQPPPIPPRRTNPVSFGLRWRRKRNAIFRQIKNFTLEYSLQIKLYAFIALFIDYLTTSAGLILIQQIHLADFQLDGTWQNTFPPVLLACLYTIPTIGIVRQVHVLLLIYVTFTSLYFILAFCFTTRSAFHAHYGHYFYKVHYCSTKYTSSDSVICIVSLLKIVFFWPVFRCYMHARDCLEFSYYLKREDQNTYGLVDFDGVEAVKPSFKNYPKYLNAKSNLYTSEPHLKASPISIRKTLSRMSDLNPINHYYKNSKTLSSDSSSLASTLDGIQLVDGVDDGYMDDSEMEIQFFEEGVFMDDDEDYSDRSDIEKDPEEPTVIKNRLFQP